MQSLRRQSIEHPRDFKNYNKKARDHRVTRQRNKATISMIDCHCCVCIGMKNTDVKPFEGHCVFCLEQRDQVGNITEDEKKILDASKL